MKYTSTRDKDKHVSAAQIIIDGLAKDGGLFIPEKIPQINEKFLKELLAGSYQQRAEKILSLYLADYTSEEIKACVSNAYTADKFDTDAVAPLVKLADGEYMLELWHGPTSAFKDMALQLLPQLMSAALSKTQQKNDIAILVATSGDTGKAALEGFCDVAKIKIIVFYPAHGVSKIQQRQMITQKGKNVEVIAIEGNFDDAQSGVKKIFGDKKFIDKLHKKGYDLSSANSINWGRLLPQTVYYFSAYCDLVNNAAITLGDKVNYTVPTGNFGDILAGYYAKKMGLPVGRLICASNANNVLTDFFKTGTYDKNREFFKTSSPSMDILISSNLERLLADCSNSDEELSQWMNALSAKGSYTVPNKVLERLHETFSAAWVNEAETAQTIKDVYKSYNYVIDPHTAVAYHAAQKYKKNTGDNTPMVVLSTASPYKFNENVLKALDIKAKGADEFALLDLLHQYNKNPVPQNLAKLKTDSVLHDKSCSKENMAEEVEKFLKA